MMDNTLTENGSLGKEFYFDSSNIIAFRVHLDKQKFIVVTYMVNIIISYYLLYYMPFFRYLALE